MRETARSFGVALVLPLALAILAACGDGTASNEAAATEDGAADGAAEQVGAVVETSYGSVEGMSVTEDGDVVHVFRGVPYAAPPVGDLRWRPPQPPESWDGVRDATEWAHRCPQGESSQGTGDISEDCLYLNVNTPAESTDDALPVMVFYHGGGLTTGTANSEVYNDPSLPTHGVVLVTVNSRLGPMGYMAHPALTAESEHDASGNFGTLDLVASLEWVQENIEAFGGDPDNVMIFGESGGGTKTLSLLSSPLAEGLFHRAAIQSGSALISPERTTTLDSAEARGERIAAELGVQDDESVLSALREASWEDVIAAGSADDVGFQANLVVDGWVLPVSVHETFQQGRQHDVPIIVGANAGEQGELQENVPMLAGSHGSTASSDAYVYNFSHLPTGWRTEPCVAFHGVEIPYVFGAVPEGLSVPTILFLSQGGGCTSDDPGADERDEEVAQNVMSLWSQFARTGDPSVEGLVEWPPYTEESPQYLEIGYELEVREGIEDAYVAPPEN